MRNRQQPFRPSAANDRVEPDTVIEVLCCARSQHKNCGGSEKFDAALQRMLRPFMQVAA